MKIIINSEDKKIKLIIPLSVMKWKVVYKNMLKNSEMTKKDKEILEKKIPLLIKTVKKYIKENGHFTFVEVESEKRKILIFV